MSTIEGVAKRYSVVGLIVGAIFLTACSQKLYLSQRDSEIRQATAAIAAAKNDAQRAAAYADRGDGYGEKARYSGVMKLVSVQEYNKLFDLAVQDFNQAVALDPQNAEMYYRRGHNFYNRAAVEMIMDIHATTYLQPAKLDFAKALEKNPKHFMALDMLGLSDASLGEWTEAIDVFGKEVALDSTKRFRLSDAYCNRGLGYLAGKQFERAAADFNQAIELEVRKQSDPCECEPYGSLMTIYLNQTHQYDKAREVAAKAQASGRWIAPQYLEQLQVSRKK